MIEIASMIGTASSRYALCLTASRNVGSSSTRR